MTRGFRVLVACLVLLPTLAVAETVRVKVKLANIRRAPDVESPVVTLAPQGTSLEVLGRDGEWYRVKLAQGEGYVFARLVEAVEAQPPVAPATEAPAETAPTAPAAGLAIEHKAVACIVAEQNARFDACFDPADGVSRARVNFRASGTPHWYYVDMARDAGCFSGVLPRASRKTKAVDYYIDVVDRSFAESRTQEYAPAVVRSAADCRDREALAASVGGGTIVVGAAPGAPALPAGFLQTGIAAAGSPAAGAAGSGGQGGGGAGAAGTGAAAGAGISGTTLALIGGGVAAAAGVALAAGGGGEPDPAQQDNDRDGFTPAAGDCNDASAAVNPNGTFTLQNARFETTNSTCPNGASNSPQAIAVVADATNNRCAAVSISAVTLTFVTVETGGVQVPGSEFDAAAQFTPSSFDAQGRGALRVTTQLFCTNPRGNRSTATDFSVRLTVATSAGSATVQTSNLFHTEFPLGLR
jgi:hypothetical protein